MEKLDEQLKAMESRHSIPYRWSPLDSEFQQYKSLIQQNKKQQLLSGVWAAAHRRRFLLNLKAKYAGMLYCVV